jgi:hypothetical protein
MIVYKNKTNRMVSTECTAGSIALVDDALFRVIGLRFTVQHSFQSVVDSFTIHRLHHVLLEINVTDRDQQSVLPSVNLKNLTAMMSVPAVTTASHHHTDGQMKKTESGKQHNPSGLSRPFLLCKCETTFMVVGVLALKKSKQV